WIGGIAGKCVLVWDVNSGKHLLSLPHKAEVQQAEFSPDVRRLVTACADLDDTRLAAQVWDVPSGRPLGKPIIPPLRHLEPPSSAQFVADGQRIVTRRLAGDCWIWDLPAHDRSAAD